MLLSLLRRAGPGRLALAAGYAGGSSSSSCLGPAASRMLLPPLAAHAPSTMGGQGGACCVNVDWPLRHHALPLGMRFVSTAGFD